MCTCVWLTKHTIFVVRNVKEEREIIIRLWILTCNNESLEGIDMVAYVEGNKWNSR